MRWSTSFPGLVYPFLLKLALFATPVLGLPFPASGHLDQLNLLARARLLPNHGNSFLLHPCAILFSRNQSSDAQSLGTERLPRAPPTARARRRPLGLDARAARLALHRLARLDVAPTPASLGSLCVLFLRSTSPLPLRARWLTCGRSSIDRGTLSHNGRLPRPAPTSTLLVS